MDRADRLGEGSIPSLLLKFSAPAVVGMLAQALYNVVDRIFVGQGVGPDGIAGTTVAFPFMLILLAFGMLIGFGATALVSIRLGEQNRDEAERVLGNATVLLVGVSLLITVVATALLDPLLRLFGASDQVLPYAHDYSQIVVLGSLFQMIGFGLNAIIRGEGNPKIAMFTMLIGALLNMALDPIFIFGFGWGMRGAAWATVASQAVSALWVVGYFLGGRSLLKLHAGNLTLQWRVCASIVAIGSPPFAMQIAAATLNAILNNQLHAYGGDPAISVMGIVHAVALFIAMPVFGITQGAQPIIGYNYGAESFDRVKKTLLTAILAATTITAAGFFVAQVFPSQVIRLFSRDDQALIRLGTHAIRICLVMFPIVGFQIVSGNYFQAVGKPAHALLLSLSRQVLLLIPAVYVLPCFFGLDGIWAAFPAADLGSSILTGTWLLLELRHLRRRHMETMAEETTMDQPMSNFHFWGMSAMFRIRDLLLPRQRLLSEAKIPAGACVLDYGCGPGSYTVAAAELVGQTGKVIALDIHPKAMKAVQKRAAKRGLANVETLCAADPSGLAPESVDVVLLYDTFHMLSDQDAVLRGLHRALKPDGFLSFSDHHMEEAEIVKRLTSSGLFKLVEKGKHTHRFAKTV